MQKLLPHGELQAPVDGLWMVTGMCPFPLRRSMTVWRAPDGSLIAHSVIRMNDEGMARLDALGPVSIILVPHTGHRLDARFYKERYPKARVVAPAAARAKVEEIIPVESNVEDEMAALGAKVHGLPGWKHGELAYQVPLPAGGNALVVGDTLANNDPPPGLGGWLMGKTAGGVKGRLGTARIVRTMLLADRAAARAGLERLAEIADLRFLSIAHGRPLDSEVAAAITEAAATLG